MMTITNIANDEFDIEHLEFVGSTLAYSTDENLVFNHQSVYSKKLVLPSLNAKQEALQINEILKNKKVSICLNCNAMWDQDSSTFAELADFTYDDWFIEGTVTDIQPGQLKLETDDGSRWIPFKHLDTIETAEGQDEPVEIFEEAAE